MANNSSQKRYPDELKEWAVKMVLELRRDDPSPVATNRGPLNGTQVTESG